MEKNRLTLIKAEKMKLFPFFAAVALAQKKVKNKLIFFQDNITYENIFVRGWFLNIVNLWKSGDFIPRNWKFWKSLDLYPWRFQILSILRIFIPEDCGFLKSWIFLRNPQDLNPGDWRIFIPEIFSGWGFFFVGRIK